MARHAMLEPQELTKQIFAVDRNGIVQGSYEILASQAELDAIFPVITAGG